MKWKSPEYHHVTYTVIKEMSQFDRYIYCCDVIQFPIRLLLLTSLQNIVVLPDVFTVRIVALDYILHIFSI